MSRFLKPPAEPDPRPPATSVYEGRGASSPATVVVSATSGRVLGHEVDGEFVKAGPCCDDPTKCERPECWHPIGPPGGLAA
jgi:hypothetical protein